MSNLIAAGTVSSAPKKKKKHVRSWLGHTVSAIVLDDPAHAHGGGAFQQRPRDDSVGSRDGLATARDGQDPVVNALHHLADAGLHAGFVAQIGNILPAFPDDHAGFLGGHDGPQRQLRLGILFVRLGRRLAVRAQARLVFAEPELVHSLGQVGPIGRDWILRCRHSRGRRLMGNKGVVRGSWRVCGLRASEMVHFPRLRIKLAEGRSGRMRYAARELVDSERERNPTLAPQKKAQSQPDRHGCGAGTVIDMGTPDALSEGAAVFLFSRQCFLFFPDMTTAHSVREGSESRIQKEVSVCHSAMASSRGQWRGTRTYLLQ